MTYKILRIARIVVSLVCLAVLTAALAWSVLLIPGFYEWLTSVQLMPAAIRFGMVVFVVWLIVTLLFGRIYCSTVCPLGTLQDIASRAVRLKRKRLYHYSPPRTKVRYVALIITVLCLLGGFWLPVSLVDPYELYARFCTDTFAPASRAINNMAASAGCADVPFVPVLMTSSAATALAALLLLAVLCVAARRGRLVCNTVCPVGTTLGLISRYAVWQIDMDTDKCTQCGLCQDVCKGECIDLLSHVVDGSRCVNCMDCVAVCRDDAIHYTWKRKQLADPMMQPTGKSAQHKSPAMENTAENCCSKGADGDSY